MATIHVLPETVQNKIAAGEVIERPASVVKELAENAMDAGATMVSVDLEEGGHRLIRVSDDGGGMDEADLVACMQRHATSKIRDVDDIFDITTFGFRGEALPSIGSVSRMSILTCPKGGKEGRELLIDAGKMLRVTPAAPRKGTRVEVRDIFFNTPARRKFLRQPASEGTRANEILTRLALGNPEIGFRLQTNDRITLAVNPAANQLERIGELFGKELAAKMVPFSSEITEGLSVSGFFAKPPVSRRTTKEIFILVNRRWIRYYGLAKAIGDAFQGILPPREHPFAVVNLTVDPARVDVNVHPAKEEVRFEQERLLVGGVRRAIREALDSVASVSTFQNVAASPIPAPTRDADAPSEREHGAFPPPAATVDVQRRLDMPAAYARTRSRDFSDVDLGAVRERLRGGERNEDLFGQHSRPETSGQATEPDVPADKTPDETSGRSGIPVPEGGIAVGRYRVMGQAGGKYILVDCPGGVLMVDPHALHERWNYDRLVEERKRGATARTLLLPVEMRLSPAESAAAIEAVPSLAEYGFEFELPGPGLMRVTAAPSYVKEANLENLLRQVLADVGEADGAVMAARDRLLASLACRSSVLLGKTLPEEEMFSLLDRFFNQGQMPTCPHGRPTAILVTWEELGRRFGR